MSVLSDRIREIRGKTTRREFSELIEISESSLVKYEQGDRVPNADTIEQICTKLQVNANWLVLGQGPKLAGETIYAGSLADPSPAEIKPAMLQVFQESKKIQHTENTTSQTTKTCDVAGSSSESSLITRLLDLHEKYGATLRELADLQRELTDLRVEAERLKMDQERRERDTAELEREIFTLQRRLACYEPPGGAAHPNRCPTGPAATAPGVAGSRPGLEGAIVPPAPETATAPDE